MFDVVLVGEQDLTAHVDFTALLRAGEESGLATVAFTRQALWLTAAGLFLTPDPYPFPR